jgi:hypothetical protein
MITRVAYVVSARSAINIAPCLEQICGKPLALKEKWHNLAAVGDPRACWTPCTSASLLNPTEMSLGLRLSDRLENARKYRSYAFFLVLLTSAGLSLVK